MSKRHQSSRRKSYGRRQHEVHERTGRRDRDTFESALDDDVIGPGAAEGPFHGYGPSAGRLGFALAD